MRIIGIDPGSHTTGYAVIDVSGNTTRLTTLGVVRSAAASMPARLLEIHRSTLLRKIRNHRLDI